MDQPHLSRPPQASGLTQLRMFHQLKQHHTLSNPQRVLRISCLTRSYQHQSRQPTQALLPVVRIKTLRCPDPLGQCIHLHQVTELTGVVLRVLRVPLIAAEHHTQISGLWITSRTPLHQNPPQQFTHHLRGE